MQPLPFHSSRYLQSVLETAFGDGSTFRVVQSEIVSRAARLPRAPGRDRHGDDRDLRYRSLCLGHQRLLDTLPTRRLVPSSDDDGAGTIVEVGVFVFVAERL